MPVQNRLFKNLITAETVGGKGSSDGEDTACLWEVGWYYFPKYSSSKEKEAKQKQKQNKKEEKTPQKFEQIVMTYI